MKKVIILSLILCAIGSRISAQVNTEKITNNNTSSNFPTYVNTGNSALDGANYEAAKQEWIKNNPEKYALMNDTKVESVNPPVNITKEEKDHWIQENHNSYSPQIIDVNPNITKEEKDKWVIENRDFYNSLTPNEVNNSSDNVVNTETNKNLHSISKTEFDTMPEAKKQHILAHPELYIVVQ